MPLRVRDMWNWRGLTQNCGNPAVRWTNLRMNNRRSYQAGLVRHGSLRRWSLPPLFWFY